VLYPKTKKYNFAFAEAHFYRYSPILKIFFSQHPTARDDILFRVFPHDRSLDWVKKSFKEKLCPVRSKTHNFCPSEAKVARFQSLLSSWCHPLEGDCSSY